MKILSILKPKPDADKARFAALRRAEEVYVWKQYTGGPLREMYFQPEPLHVLLVWELASIPEARHALNKFPMVQEGLFDLEFYSLGPWLPIEALFAQNSTEGDV